MRVSKWFLLLVLLFFAGCDFYGNDDEDDGDDDSGSTTQGGGSGGGSGGGGKTPGSTRENAISVSVGNSSSHTISSSGTHWFKFVGDGNPVIFETRGNTVDTYISVFQGNNITGSANDNGGEGSNALYTQNTTSGTNYFIKITARSNTSGSYTFVVTIPTSNLRTNPITVTVGNSSSHIISSSGTHWFKFVGDGNRVFFETGGNVVNTNIRIYTGDNTSSSYQREEGVNFITVSGTTYYISITGNSGTYTFNLRYGTGDGSSKYNAEEVNKGYSSSHTISSSGEHWFIYQGTGNPVTFKTTGNVVDTYISVFQGNNITGSANDNGGEGSNALYTQNTTSGTNYFIKITAKSNTYGAYTFVVE
ncbi:MAG: hypothetical protein FWF51_11670 [Chitinivibrionia bacterium]|nr:hypothetical protein [Chitinivibrionia bacterium]